MADVASSSESGKSYKKPNLPDTETVAVEVPGSVTAVGEETIPQKDVAAARAPETGSYSGKGADFSRARRQGRDIAGSLIRTYEGGGPFIKEVSVYEWGGQYGFYEKFLNDAFKYKDLHGKPTEHVPFFSYIPQYSQMKPNQFAYYLWLRDEIRARRFPLADLSYLLLLVYEIINLGDASDNEKDADLLCSLWSSYRTLYPILDKYLSEWCVDYCLIHSVPMPAFFRPTVPAVAAKSSLKEFYFESVYVENGEDVSAFADCIVSSASDYVPEKSRYLSDDPELMARFKTIFRDCVSEMIRRRIGAFSADEERETVVKRDAYSGSLCSYSVKKRLTVTVRTPFRSQDVRKQFTEILRYCENTARKSKGIRSRLTVEIPDQLSELIRSSPSSRTEGDSYLAKYDAPRTGFSVEGAVKIERESWENADRLTVPDEQTEDTALFAPALTGQSPQAASSVADVYDGRTDREEDENPFRVLKRENPSCRDLLVRLIEDGSTSFSDLCRAAGSFPDSAAEIINDVFYDSFGDVILDRAGDDYVLLDCYLDDVESLMRSADSEAGE